MTSFYLLPRRGQRGVLQVRNALPDGDEGARQGRGGIVSSCQRGLFSQFSQPLGLPHHHQLAQVSHHQPAHSQVREPSVCSRGSSGAGEGEMEEREVHGSQLVKASSMSSLGTRWHHCWQISTPGHIFICLYTAGLNRWPQCTARARVATGQ